jgi:hypothetical protein
MAHQRNRILREVHCYAPRRHCARGQSVVQHARREMAVIYLCMYSQLNNSVSSEQERYYKHIEPEDLRGIELLHKR